MTTLLVDLRRRGLALTAEGSRLRVAPKSALTPELRETLAARKADLLAALSVEDHLLQMPLDQFEREGPLIEIKVPGFPETLWFAPGDREREILVVRGISRGRIWTAHELMDLWKIPSLTREQAQTLARIKADFDAEVISIEPLSSAPDPKDGAGA